MDVNNCKVESSEAEHSDWSLMSDEMSGGRKRRRRQNSTSMAGRKRKPALTARERNLRRLESNERERMRMHSLNDAFQVME